MTDNNNNSTGGWYWHDNAENCIKFQAKVKSIARSHTNANVFKVLKGQAVAAELIIAAKADLYDVIVRQIADAQLIATLEQSHEDEGKNAYDYIVGGYNVGADENKQEAMDEEYIAKLCGGVPPDASAPVVRDFLTGMTTLRNTLKTTSYAMPNKRHSRYMIRVVKNMSEAHRAEVRLLAWTDDVLEDCAKVLGMLEGVVANLAKRAQQSGTALTAMLAQKAMTEEDVLALIAKHKSNNNFNRGTKSPCKYCAKLHNGECYAWQIATTGKEPEAMSKLTASSQTAIRELARQIQEKGNKPLVALAGPTQSVKVMAAVAPTLVRIKVDSQAGAGYPYHYISDMSMVIRKARLPSPIVVGGIGDAKAVAEFIGTVAFVTNGGREVVLENCLLSSQLQHSLFSTSAALQHGVKTYLNYDNYLEWPSGTQVSFNNSELELRGRSLEPSRAAELAAQLDADGAVDVCAATVVDTLARFETVQYGKDGKVHIDVNPMSDKERAEFALHSARLNDPSAERLRFMHKIAEGVPPILRKANLVNTATDTRLVANPVQSPAKPGTTPVPQRPGARTDMDIASGPVKSVLGNAYILGCRDGASTNFRVYPMKSKGQSPAAQNQYYLDAKALGVDVDAGGTLHSDNEIVLNSAAMNAVAAAHQQTRSNSNEYEPTGNPAETIFRVLWPEMRKNTVRSGVPQEFWDFNALDCEIVCRDTRMRGGDATPGELFTGKRADVSKRKVWGCLVYAQVPAPWREHKQSARGVKGINLGKARTKSGYWVWSPEVGLFTTKHLTWRETQFPFKDGTFVWGDKPRAAPGTGGGGMDSTFMPDLPEADDGEDDDDRDDGGGGDDEVDDDDGAGNSMASGEGLGVNAPLAAIPGMANYSVDSDSDADSISHGTLDDPAGNSHSSDVEYQPGDDGPPHMHLDVELVQVLVSSLKLEKTKRAQKEAGIPPPWQGLNVAPDHVKQMFLEAEMKEINGILDAHAAYEKIRSELPEGTQIYNTLTLRDIKKNGPKKGQPKVRVCVDKGPQGVESHSPTMQMPTLRAILAMIAAKRAKGAAGDFPQAYLNADQEIYYVWPPKTARQHDEQGRRLVWALPKALYGGRASGRHWYKMLRKWFVEHGFRVSEWDPCLFVKVEPDGNFHYIGLYVDDLVHAYSDQTAYDAVVAEFRNDFHGYTELPLSEIFNAEVAITDQFVTLTQTRYIEALQGKFLSGETVSATRTPAEIDLEEVVKKAAEAGKGNLSAENHAKYREIVGAILYIATVCRPDIAVAVGLLSRVLEYPNELTLAAAYRVLRYLVTTKILGLRWTVGGGCTLSGMSDSNWAVVKSTSGYVFFLCQAAIAYISKKQASIAMSSTEAEIMAASLAALEAVFLRGILSEMQCLQEQPTVIGVDNQGAIALAKNYISNSRTKHIERRHLKIRELVEEMMVRPEFVPTDENAADIMSKPLGRAKFEKFRKIILNHEV